MEEPCQLSPETLQEFGAQLQSHCGRNLLVTSRALLLPHLAHFR